MYVCMLLHIPHSSVKIPKDVRSSLLLSDDQLHQELLRMTDWFTDQLFDMDGMKRLLYPVSRLVCDPERFREDKDEPMAKVGMGVIYTRTSDGKILRTDPTAEQRKTLLRKYYEPHHALLTAGVEGSSKNMANASS